MALRALKSTTVSFGMVVMPVKVYPSTGSTDKSSFNQIHTACGTRIKMPKSCPKCNKVLEAGEISKGYSLGKGADGQEKFLLLTEADLDSIPLETAQNIAIDAFVPAEALVDPRWLEDVYILAPEPTAIRPYSLFSKAMRESNVFGVAKVCLKEQKEHLAIVRPFDDMLALQMLRWGDELRDYTELKVFANVSDKELDMAKMLIKAMVKPVDLKSYQDEYKVALLKLIQAKLDGKVIEQPVAVKQAEPDMMDALMASLAAVGVKA